MEMSEPYEELENIPTLWNRRRKPASPQDLQERGKRLLTYALDIFVEQVHQPLTLRDPNAGCNLESEKWMTVDKALPPDTPSLSGDSWKRVAMDSALVLANALLYSGLIGKMKDTSKFPSPFMLQEFRSTDDGLVHVCASLHRELKLNIFSISYVLEPF